MDIKKHLDTIVILSAVLVAVLWINSSINHLRMDMEKKINRLDIDVAVIKTVLLMRDQYPKELARSSNCVEKTEG